MIAACGGCGYEGLIDKGWRIRGTWKRCPDCVAHWRQQRQGPIVELDQAEKEDWMQVDKKRVKMGWNGTPSERSLRRRSS